jgi:hypothetical protein
MVSSIFYKRISVRFRIYFAFKVSENTTKYVDIVRMISSIPSLSLECLGVWKVGVRLGPSHAYTLRHAHRVSNPRPFAY